MSNLSVSIEILNYRIRSFCNNLGNDDRLKSLCENFSSNDIFNYLV